MNRVEKSKVTSINTIVKMVNVKGTPEEVIKELQQITPKVFISDILGENHWIVNEHGKSTCMQCTGNFATYVSEEYGLTPNDFEVEVLDMSIHLKNAIQTSRYVQKLQSTKAHVKITESHANVMKMSLQYILLTLKSLEILHDAI
jgi:hypothetical protein